MPPLLPRYPVYVPSKGRADACLTARFLEQDGVPFRLVVEPQEADAYAARHGADRLLVLPFGNLGMGATPARNWIKAHATAEGHARHWQLDDNMAWISRRHRNKRIRCDAGPALRAVEDFADRYENVAVAGLNYEMFAVDGQKLPPFHLNVHVYSCTLVLNAIPYGWRDRYNDDTDLCLQVLAGGWCTVLVNAFLVWKIRTMAMKGGMTTELYAGDGRLKMARALERRWPGVVTTDRRFRRPQHVIRDQWRGFDTPLKLKPGIDLAALPGNDYGLALTEVRPPKNGNLRHLLAEREDDRGHQAPGGST
jgi:hypothetical protein